MLLFIGFIIIAIARILYDDYMDSLRTYNSLSNLFQNLGLGSFSFATFLGALKDDSLSNDIRRAMIFISGLGILAIVLLNIDISYYGGWRLFY